MKTTRSSSISSQAVRLGALAVLALAVRATAAPDFPDSPNRVLDAGLTPAREAEVQKLVGEVFATLSQEQKILQLMGEADLPKLARGEAISGYNIKGATTLPQQIGISCSWNPALLKTNTEFTSRLMRTLGTTLALSPMLDVSRNAQWGRMEESFGEDPYLTSRMGLAFVTGMQGDDLRQGVAATTKHFAGYGGRNDNLREFFEEILKPHEVVIRLANAQSVMPGYHKYGDKPCSASPFLLQEILRTKWGFQGVVVSDYFAVKQVFTTYKVAKDKKEAAAICVRTGIDLELPAGDAYKELGDAVKEGLLSQEELDRAVKRILTLKGRLGILDPKNPITIDKTVELDPPAYRQRAYESACQSLVLLKNTGVLPLAKSIRSLAVVGPNADAVESLLGDYTEQTLSLYWGKKPLSGTNPKLFTLLEGLQSKVGKDMTIRYERGCDWSKSYKDAVLGVNKEVGDEREKKVVEITSKDFGIPNPEKALEFARQSDVIIAAMGENRYLCGESRDRKDIRLAGEQEEFVKKLIATGKPVVLIVFGGRPHVLTDVEPGCSAILQAWYPGEEGGNAVADLLLGTVNPSGKMTVTVPRKSDQCPIFYQRGYDPANPPLYPFGHGLSYTRYTYSGLALPAKAKTTDQWIAVSFTIENSGDRAGAEIAQLYIASSGLSMPRPAMKMEGFARVELAAGQAKTVTLYVSPEQFSFYDGNMDLVIEPGTYEFRVGASSTDLPLKATVELGGEKRVLPQRSVFFSETVVE